MTEVLRAALGIIAAAAPFGAVPVLLSYGHDSDGRLASARLGLVSSGAALVLLVVAALVADPFLDLIDVSPETFQFAAGAIMAPLAFRLLLTGNSATVSNANGTRRDVAWLLPLAFPVLAGPPALAAAMTYATRYGEGEAIAGAFIALVLSGAVLAVASELSRTMRPLGVNALGRLSGALLVVVAVELAVDGVRSV